MRRQGRVWVILFGFLGFGWAGGASLEQPADSEGARVGQPARDATARPSGWRRDTVLLSSELVARLGITTEPVRESEHSGVLVLRGVLRIDPSRMVRIRPRFHGEVVEVGTVPDAAGHPRPLGSGDRVDRDQMLAVVWSSTLSEKKNELVELLLQARLKRERFERMDHLHQQQAVSLRSYQEADRALEEAEIAVARAERSLWALGVTEDEIQAIETEAQKVEARNIRTPFDPEQGWGQLTIRSPIEGWIIEAGVALGDMINTNEVIYEVADLSHLIARVPIHEADLPMVEALPRPIRWTLRLEHQPETALLSPVIDTIGIRIDPTDRTAALSGIVENPEGRLHPGQSITAEIELPPGPELVEIPLSARIESDGQTLVFVQPEAEEPVFVLRPVRPVRVSQEFLTTRQGTPQGLRPGDRVVTAGASKLKAILDGAAPTIAHGP